MNHPIEQLEDIMAQLRDPDSGCPWDKKQTFDTIIPHTIEETFEVVDAISNQDWDNLKEELGDLLFQVIFYSQLAKEKQLFEFKEVVETVNEKLTRRHPHVFADLDVQDEEQLNENWEQEKRKEKQRSGQVEESILDSVPQSLPALSKANKIQKKCAKVGFDWAELPPVVDKVREEIDEVLQEVESGDSDKLEEELGDLLFATVNLVRHLGKDPEVALTKANQKFSRRFQSLERLVKKDGKHLENLNLDELDKVWDRVKSQEDVKGVKHKD
ncbi:nucleoside triphosphate pyrophosphohydrolase [Vibrio marisflavi]|uniref:Nucleoside triphosphate pyrophosphohydrolase n=1 Tax=Vibrio marisflavi CECT 7928 TaxID=634439 RepID=A0ABN8E964_9VIBR|nr:nucleoside triphosphate pyrophosphohydrolase [Vibrio marisflavi]CAH0541378.1 Nucleoside triphosphate pyrophosphohydrolase [Vibrio marisflavi CECT 7928]